MIVLPVGTVDEIVCLMLTRGIALGRKAIYYSYCCDGQVSQYNERYPTVCRRVPPDVINHSQCRFAVIVNNKYCYVDSDPTEKFSLLYFLPPYRITFSYCHQFHYRMEVV